MPGTDPAEAAATVVGELPDLPHLPELPKRGLGADLIGRTAGLLVDLAVEVVPSGYRTTAKPGLEGGGGGRGAGRAGDRPAGRAVPADRAGRRRAHAARAGHGERRRRVRRAGPPWPGDRGRPIRHGPAGDRALLRPPPADRAD